MKILVTGSAGFICGYVVAELLEAGHDVYGIDNFSKYGKVEKSYDTHPRYHFVEGDAKNVGLMKELAGECDQVLAAAAMIGGISYFHEFAYDLLAENERIMASTFDAAIFAHKHKQLKKISVLSSSMVYESATEFPTKEGAARTSPPPLSTYGFQKLACEYFAQGAFEQFGLPFTVIRPFNCVGIGEKRVVRHGHHVGQREIGHEPRGARPGAEDSQGAGPAAHPGCRQSGAPLHLRRRFGPRHSHLHGASGRHQPGLQHLDASVDVGAGAGRDHLEPASSRGSRSATCRTRLTNTTCRCACPT